MTALVTLFLSPFIFTFRMRRSKGPRRIRPKGSSSDTQPPSDESKEGGRPLRVAPRCPGWGFSVSFLVSPAPSAPLKSLFTLHTQGADEFHVHQKPQKAGVCEPCAKERMISRQLRGENIVMMSIQIAKFFVLSRSVMSDSF